MSSNTPPQREIVFCHTCEDEWLREERGLVCPSCGGDFVEILENMSDDPREAQAIDEDHTTWSAPDPDEDDIEQYEPQGFRARIERTRSQESQPAVQQGGGLMSLLGSAIRTVGDLIQPPETRQQPQDQRPQSPTLRSTTQRSLSPNGSTTITRQMQGDGFVFSMTTTSTNNGGLFPRDPHHPQPVQNQPQQVHELMQQMLRSMGTMPPGFMLGPHTQQGGGPRWNDPTEALRLFGLPIGGIHGDAAYSEEGLDRIISQLLDQNPSQAPGPASANAIQSLPQRPIIEADLGEGGTADCSICMESVPLGEKVTTLPCTHWFHFECINAWLSTHDTCPHCRQGIMPRNGDGNGNVPNVPQVSSQHVDRHGVSSSPPPQHVPGAFATPARSQEERNAMHEQMRRAFGDSTSSGSNNNSQR